METRRFKHPCKGCRFLGGYEYHERKYDLYYCANQLVARYGDEPEDFDGFFVGSIGLWGWRMQRYFPGITEAHRRMKLQQLFL